MKEFTSEELLTFNGKEGNPVCIAFQGKIYDVSKSPLWSKGLHMNRHPSGKDLTGEISAAPHGQEVFERYPQIGVLKKGAPDISRAPFGLPRRPVSRHDDQRAIERGVGAGGGPQVAEVLQLAGPRPRVERLHRGEQPERDHQPSQPTTDRPTDPTTY